MYSLTELLDSFVDTFLAAKKELEKETSQLPLERFHGGWRPPQRQYRTTMRRQHEPRVKQPRLNLDGVDELASETVVDDETGQGSIPPLDLAHTSEDTEA